MQKSNRCANKLHKRDKKTKTLACDMKKDNNLKNKHVAQTIFPQRLLN